MCSNYRPVTRLQRLLKFFSTECNLEEPGTENDAWPLGLAPFIRVQDDGTPGKVVEAGHFGLIPNFSTELVYGRKTYNARCETVHQLPSFREAWSRGWRCIVPAEWVYEPCYASGKAVRWRVQLPNGIPMGIAGIYRRWRDSDGVLHWSFAMLTVNADGHPVYDRMHAPGHEKRMICILKPEDYDRWLTCTPGEAMHFFKRWEGPLEASPDPLPPRTKR